jgi:hypothetical protein
MHNFGEQSCCISACVGVMALGGVLVFNVTYLTGFLGLNFPVN